MAAMPLGAAGQDISFSQTFESPLFLSPSFTGLTNGSRVGGVYRNQWPGIGKAFQVYSIYADHFFERFNSGLGLLWTCDNQGQGLIVDNQVSLLYSYEVALMENLYFRPGIAFEFGQRKIDQSKMITYTDITSDGLATPGGSSIEFERTRNGRLDAASSLMLYNDEFMFGVSVDHLLRPDNSFTDTKNKVLMKTTVHASYVFTYEPSYRGSEPKTITLAANYKNQYSYNQLELGVYWYYFPIEVGASYRGLFFNVSGELQNRDAIVPNIGVNIYNWRIGYSYDITISELSSFGNGAHEFSLVYRFIPDNVKDRNYKMKPVPCTEPIMGYSYSGQGSKRHGHGYRRRGLGHNKSSWSRRK